MSVEKARAALEAVKTILDTADPDDKGHLPIKDLENLNRLLKVAEVQALIAQAEALERVGSVLERRRFCHGTSA